MAELVLGLEEELLSAGAVVVGVDIPQLRRSPGDHVDDWSEALDAVCEQLGLPAKHPPAPR